MLNSNPAPMATNAPNAKAAESMTISMPVILATKAPSESASDALAL